MPSLYLITEWVFFGILGLMGVGFLAMCCYIVKGECEIYGIKAGDE
jgi:hypothetical protein